MKSKIAAFLKTRLVGVPDAFIQGVAEQYGKTITDEAQIATVISDGVVDVLKASALFAQQEGDRRAQGAQKTALDEFRKKHNLDENGKPIITPQPAAIPQGGDMPDWAKTLIETQSKQIADLTALVNGVKTSQTTAQRQAAAYEQLAKSKLPKAFQEKWKSRINVDSDTSIEDQIAALEAEGLELQQLSTNAAVERGDFIPAQGKSVASDADIVKIMTEAGSSEQTKVGVAQLNV